MLPVYEIEIFRNVELPWKIFFFPEGLSLQKNLLYISYIMTAAKSTSPNFAGQCSLFLYDNTYCGLVLKDIISSKV